MKQLELQLKKRLLIVEYQDKREAEMDLQTHKAFPEYDKTVICLGREFDEEIAKDYVFNILHEHGLEMFEKHNATEKEIQIDHWSGVTDNAFESFISAIEAKGYFWGENPVKKPKTIEYNDFDYLGMEIHDRNMKAFRDAESRTFNPEKTLIFEIL